MQRKKGKGGNKKTLIVIFLISLTVVTFIWHEIRVSKRDAKIQSNIIE